MALNAIQALALAAILWMIGDWVKSKIHFIDRYNLPGPVIGGLLMAIPLSILRATHPGIVTIDTTFQEPLMIAFFTSVGFGASFELLKKGGVAVIWFLLACSVFAILQNGLGIGLALLFEQHPLVGVLTGSVALTGGPGTALAFATTFEENGIVGASALGLAAAMLGILSGGIIGTPVATRLIHGLGIEPHAYKGKTGGEEVDDGKGDTIHQLLILLIVMGFGVWLGQKIKDTGAILPIYIGSMIVAGIFRNFDDKTKLLRIDAHQLDKIGEVALSLFIALSVMNLKLEALTETASFLVVMLLLQNVLIILGAVFVIYRFFGRDYQAAVTSSGFIGFMMGTTANAMANMNSLVRKYGPAPRSFLIVPLVGACFIDFINGALVTLLINFFK